MKIMKIYFPYFTLCSLRKNTAYILTCLLIHWLLICFSHFHSSCLFFEIELLDWAKWRVIFGTINLPHWYNTVEGTYWPAFCGRLLRFRDVIDYWVSPGSRTAQWSLSCFHSRALGEEMMVSSGPLSRMVVSVKQSRERDGFAVSHHILCRYRGLLIGHDMKHPSK